MTDHITKDCKGHYRRTEATVQQHHKIAEKCTTGIQAQKHPQVSDYIPAMTAELMILPAHMRSDTFPDFAGLVQRQAKEQTDVVRISTGCLLPQ